MIEGRQYRGIVHGRRDDGTVVVLGQRAAVHLNVERDAHPLLRVSAQPLPAVEAVGCSPESAGGVAEAGIFRDQHFVFATGHVFQLVAERFLCLAGDVLVERTFAGLSRDAGQLGVDVDQGHVLALAVSLLRQAVTRVIGDALFAVRHRSLCVVLPRSDGLRQVVRVRALVIIQAGQHRHFDAQYYEMSALTRSLLYYTPR